MDLFSSVRELHGVGPARAAQLEKLGIRTLYDLLAFFPRDYEDRTNPVTIAQLQPGVPACFRAMVVSQPILRRIGGGRDITKLTVADRDRQADAQLLQPALRQKPAALRRELLLLRHPAARARDADGEPRARPGGQARAP